MYGFKSIQQVFIKSLLYAIGMANDGFKSKFRSGEVGLD